VSLSRSWQFVGRVNSRSYRLYDALRRRLNGRLVRFLAGQLPPRTPRGPDADSVRVLEAGSGTAYASSLFRRAPGVRAAVCLDIDESALREARRRDPELLAVVGDMRRMPLKAGAFALVFNSSTVEHLEDPDAAVAEMHRVCGADGRVFVGVPYRYGPLAFQPLIRRTQIGEWLGPVFSPKALSDLLERAGLRPVASLRYFWNFFIGMVAAK